LFFQFALAETPHTWTNNRGRTNRVVKTQQQHNPTRPIGFIFILSVMLFMVLFLWVLHFVFH